MATAAEINEIIKLYVGYYNRAPDPAGLNFWIAAFDGGFGLDEMAVDFSTQAETLKNYPFFLNPAPTVEEYGQFVDAVYGNLFNRAPDAPGREFWSTKIASGEFSVGEAISLIIAGATTSPDQDVVANKVSVGRDFYIETNALPPYTFDDDDIEAATAIQASVTENPASVAAAAQQTDAYIAALGATTVNLTTNTDQPGGGGNGANTQGSAGDDVYNGTLQQNDTGTLNAGDSIAAGAGEDTLNIRLVAGGFNSLSTNATLVATDLEIVNVINQLTFGSFLRLDMEDATGTQQLTLQGGGGSNTVEVLKLDEGTDLRLVDTGGTHSVDFEGNFSTSSNDAFNLYVEDSGTESRSTFLRLITENFASEEGFEIANVETGGSAQSFVDFFGTTIDQLNVTGSQQIEISESSQNFNELEDVDASAMTGGGLFLRAGGVDDDFSFMGSGFDDGVLLSNSLINGSSTLNLDGGGGTDTLAVGGFTNLSASAVNAASGFEILRSDGSSSSLEASDFNNIHIFEFADQSGNTGRTSIRGVTDDDLFVFLSDDGRTDEFLQFEADVAGTSLTFEMRASSESGGQIELVANNNNNSASAIGFAGNEITEVTINSTGSNEQANLIRSVDDGSGNYFAFGNDEGQSRFNVTGSQALTIGAQEGVELTASDDERGFEEGVSLDATAFTGDLRVAGSTAADAIEGGSGDDIIYGLGGNDVLTGNGGEDQFRFSDWSGTDNILDFTSGEDKIGLQRVDFGNTNASDEGTVLSSDDYVENLQNIANMTNAESNTVVELQLAASQTQIEDTTAGAQDAYLLVFNSTTGRGELWFDADWSTDSGRSHTASFNDVTSLADLIGFSRTDFVEYEF